MCIDIGEISEPHMDLIVSPRMFPCASYSCLWVSGEGRNEEVTGGGRGGHREACSEKMNKVV